MLPRVFLIAALIFLSGCSTVKVAPVSRVELPKSLSAALAEGKEKRHALSVAIVPFGEKRGNLKSYGSVYKYLIPLVPYGSIRYERPDEAKMFNTQNEFEFNMSENLMKVVVDAVRKSGVFDNVILTLTPLESGADLILSGDILSTLYEGKTYSYGISFAGPVLWCLGLPAGSSHKKLNIMLYLKKRDTGEQIWSHTINEENTVIQGLYHNWGKEINSFVTLMNQGVKEAVADLRAKISGMPIEQLKVKTPIVEPAPLPLELKQEQPKSLEEGNFSSAASTSPINASDIPTTNP